MKGEKYEKFKTVLNMQKYKLVGSSSLSYRQRVCSLIYLPQIV